MYCLTFHRVVCRKNEVTVSGYRFEFVFSCGNLRSVWSATHTNANNSDGENAVFISTESYYKSSYYFCIRNRKRSLSTEHFLSTEGPNGENRIMRSFKNCARHRVTLEWLQQEGSKGRKQINNLFNLFNKF